LFPEDELGLCPNFTTKDSHTNLPMSRSHNGPTNPRNNPKQKATRKRNSRSIGLGQSVVPWADCLHGPGGLSAGSLWTVRNSLPNHQYCTLKNRPSAPHPQMVRAEKTVHTHLADRPANLEQPKARDKTDRKEATQYLAKNTMNTWSAGTSRTVREHLVDCPSHMDGAALTRK
jgi:hypothetical protein